MKQPGGDQLKEDHSLKDKGVYPMNDSGNNLFMGFLDWVWDLINP